MEKINRAQAKLARAKFSFDFHRANFEITRKMDHFEKMQRAETRMYRAVEELRKLSYKFRAGQI